MRLKNTLKVRLKNTLLEALLFPDSLLPSIPAKLSETGRYEKCKPFRICRDIMVCNSCGFRTYTHSTGKSVVKCLSFRR